MDLKEQVTVEAAPTSAVETAHELLTVSPSPHAHRRMSTTSLMKDVLVALAPATIWGIYAFGIRAALIVLLSVASCVLFEMLTQLVLRRTVTIADCSAAVTGLLLALNLPAGAPLYIPVVGAAFAIIVVKQLFGGLGKNIMNPALAARVFLMLAWSNDMANSYPKAFDRSFDAVASASPLGAIKGGAMPEGIDVLDLFLGNHGGCIGEISALMLLIGGIYLLCRGVIRWHIPVAMIGTVALLTFALPMPIGLDASVMERLTFMGASVFSGGLMIGAIFMATDYVTSPVTSRGRIIYGVGAGLLTVFIRYFGGLNEGVSFAILIMNCLVWYLDMATKPRVYGKARRQRKGA